MIDFTLGDVYRVLIFVSGFGTVCVAIFGFYKNSIKRVIADSLNPRLEKLERHSDDNYKTMIQLNETVLKILQTDIVFCEFFRNQGANGEVKKMQKDLVDYIAELK